MILFVWSLVGVPLGWGLYTTLLSSQTSFQVAPVSGAVASNRYGQANQTGHPAGGSAP
jgi:hypothetical protein